MARTSTTRTTGDGKGRNNGGRKKGTPNKVTRPMRELLANFCTETFDEFVNTFHHIDEPKDKCRIWLDAQSFVTPKLSSIDLKEVDKAKTLKDELEELDNDN